MRRVLLSTAIAAALTAGVQARAQEPLPGAQPSPTQPIVPEPAPLSPPPQRSVPIEQPSPPRPTLLVPQASPPPVRDTLPEPTGRPLDIDFSADPVLRLRRQQSGYERFRETIAAAVEQHPGIGEATATEDEAMGAVREARSLQRPTVDVTLQSYRVISREFSDDPENIIERSRPEQRTDAILSAYQNVLDFGASARRVSAAGARLRAAGAEIEQTADSIALNAIAAWYEVFGYRSLVDLTEAFIVSQRELRSAVEVRIRDGVSADADVARIDSYVAQAESRLARFERLLATAEARFTELTGSPPPPDLERAPTPPLPVSSRDEAALASQEAPAVRSARAIADASHDEARAARADRLPQVSAGVEAGRYGVFENERDYDIRGSVRMRWRPVGNADPRADQAVARARSADARANRIAEEAERDAAIAWTDVRALEQQLEALEAYYIASRQTRDAVAERFRTARGTLFDVVDAEDTYFESATVYIQGLTELDAARYILLSRTGRLLEILHINADRLRGESEY
jgi:adhesin transport system outer membrane protein